MQKYISAQLDQDAPLSALCQHHINKCPRCQQFVDTCNAMAQLTIAETISSKETALKDQITCNIMNAIGSLDQTAVTPKHEPKQFSAPHDRLLKAAILILAIGVATIIGKQLLQKQAPLLTSHSVMVDKYTSPAALNATAATLTSLVTLPVTQETEIAQSDSQAMLLFLKACFDLRTSPDQILPGVSDLD